MDILSRFFSPPNLGEESVRQRGMVLQVTAIIALMAGLVLGIKNASVGFDHLALSLFILAGASTLSLWLVRRDRLLLPSFALPFSALLVLTSNLIVGGTLQESGSLVYTVVIVYASLLLGKRAAILFAGLSIFSQAFVFLAYSRGWVTEMVGAQKNFSALIVTALLIGIMTAFLWIMLDSLERSFRRTQSSEARWRSLVENAPAMIINTNVEGKVEFINQWEGGEAQNLIGLSLTEFVQGEEREQALQTALHVISTGESGHFELTGLGLEGVSRFYNVSVGPIMGQNGEVEGLTFIVLDITGQKQDENEIRRLNAKLEKLLQERTEQLDVSSQDLASFSYSISHDLRTPLRAIDGFTLALLEDYGAQVGDQGQEYIRRARAASQNMGVLIDDLLRLAWIIRQEVQPTTIDFSALAFSVTDSLKPDYPGRQVDLVIQPQMEVYGDESLLRIILRSLFSNAWKFTAPRSQAKIEFGCQEIEGTPTYFIRDDGVGFDMRFANKLFQPFQHLHSLDEFEGSGIGLAIVKRIVQKHGGEIWAEAQENQGAAFYFTLRLPK